jgi:tetratricopeptide (TPR) repeat protein
MSGRRALLAGWCIAVGVAVGVRLWNALAGPLMWGYDAWGHVAYAIFLDLYRAVPWADQGWSYFHPPLHHALGWALARAGSGDVLVRGLALVGSAASLGTAALAAWLVRVAAPDRPALALVGFGAVACLPVHFYLSPMPGNELSEACLASASLAALVANERRARPTLAAAAAVGALCGLALLTKFSGLLAVVVACATLAVRAGLRGAWRAPAREAAARAAIVAGVALALSAPYYARNLLAFGTPFQLSRDFALVAAVERDQLPGRRRLLDYLRVPFATFTDPNPLAPHLLGSVWGSVYLNVWADTHRESDVARALEAERGQRRSTTAMALLGLAPTGLAALGAALAARDARRGRRREVYLPLAVQAAVSLAAFAAFSWRVPLWSALKASYLLGLSLPFAVALARGVEASLAARWRALRVVAPAALVLVAAASSAVAAAGLVLPRRADAPATGAVHFYFGEYDAARRVYGRLVAGARYPVPWLDNLAAVEIADGDPALARRLLARAVELEGAAGRSDPYRQGRLAVAMALDGDLAGARALLDDVLASQPLPELRANRGAIAAALGELAAAEADLREALAAEPAQVPAWLDLARVLDATGRADEARAARSHAARQACRAPRGYPYGVGTGEVLEWGVARRPLLLWEAEGLRVAPPRFFRRSCA